MSSPALFVVSLTFFWKIWLSDAQKLMTMDFISEICIDTMTAGIHTRHNVGEGVGGASGKGGRRNRHQRHYQVSLI